MNPESVKYDIIGKNYNHTRQADPYIVSRLYALLETEICGRYLDIGCGTGNYTRALYEMGLNIAGIDPSYEMLASASQMEPEIQWWPGTAEKTGMNNASFDGVLCTLTIHHWYDLDRAFSEIYRILKPGGRIVIFTSSPEQMEGYWLNHYFPEMLRKSIVQMPAVENLTEIMQQKGFSQCKLEKYFVQPDLADGFLYCGKHRPELYLNPAFRHGISSFSALSNQEEMMSGLSLLEADMESGMISDWIQSYENSLGDYLFVTANK